MCCLASCSSIQTLTFDQLCPATVNFPERVRNVAVVNNMPATPEAKRTLLTLGEMNGNGKKSAEMLASSLADSKYFNQVMICDSALNDTHFAGRRILTQKEVQQLAGELDADLIFSLDQVGIQTERDELVYPGIAASWPVIKAKVTPVLSIYLPERERPIQVIAKTDSGMQAWLLQTGRCRRKQLHMLHICLPRCWCLTGNKQNVYIMTVVV